MRNGLGDRVGQTVGVTTTYFALDVQGLPEVIYTSQGETFLHLPGMIMTESPEGEVRYLLSDGLGSVRQAVDEAGAVVAYQAFDPYGNPVENGSEPYGFTGEWWESYSELLYLRARWMMPETGTFLSRDPVEGEPAYAYVRGNPISLTDASGEQGCPPGVDPDHCQQAWQRYQSGTIWSGLPFPTYCRNRSSKEDYVHCVATYFGVKPTTEPPDINDVKGSQKGCWHGSFPYKAPGYVEGYSLLFTAGVKGTEIVYDFATMERQTFTYLGGGWGAENSFLAIGATNYFAHAYGFRSNSTLANDYQGQALTIYFGISPASDGRSTLLGTGFINSSPLGGSVGASGMFIGVGLTRKPSSKEDVPDNIPGGTPGGPVAGGSVATYTPKGTPHQYAPGPLSLVDIGQLKRDIWFDDQISPAFMDSFTFPGEVWALVEAHRYARIHDAIYVESQEVR